MQEGEDIRVPPPPTHNIVCPREEAQRVGELLSVWSKFGGVGGFRGRVLHRLVLGLAVVVVLLGSKVQRLLEGVCNWIIVITEPSDGVDVGKANIVASDTVRQSAGRQVSELLFVFSLTQTLSICASDGRCGCPAPGGNRSARRQIRLPACR